jgi:diaminopimelate decarboxylase
VSRKPIRGLSAAATPAHATGTGFRTEVGWLMVGDTRLDRLALRVGQTPFYAYDRALISARIADLRKVLPKTVRLHYAMKANPMPAVVQHIAGLVDGIDIASGREMLTALDTPMQAANMSIAGPGKSEKELTQAIAAGILINLESEGEMRTVARLGKALGMRPRVAVRVNPDFELKASGMRMGGGAQQFGIDAARVPKMLARIGALGLDFHGFHIYAGSQNLRSESIVEAQTKTVELAIRLATAAPSPVRHVNIGGGFGIPYFANDKPLDLSPIGANLARLVRRIGKALPNAYLVVELGRYIVGEAGIYVCRVVDRKKSRGETFLVTDGGLHHHLAASGNFGQVIRRNYPVAIGNRMDAQSAGQANVVGPLCTPLDLLGAHVDLPAARIGDYVVVFMSGAYGPTASPINFLSHPAPLEVLV